MVTESTITMIEKEYIATRKTSQELYRRALEVIPSGVETDKYYMKPFPFYVAKADGARKWDVDGNELITLTNASMILGHNPPAVVAAVAEQVKKGFIYGATHELVLELAEMIVHLVPCAEKVRFMTSGTEANMLAVRVARAFTGKNKIIKFRGHFLGYWEESMLGVGVPFDVPMSIGIPKESLMNVLMANHNSSDDVLRLIDQTGDVACVIMDPICKGFSRPTRAGFLEEVRQITKEKGVVLIFDEIMSGFRLAPGGAQEVMGVIPDLATIAKPMGGALPGSALVGKKEIMDVITLTDDPEHDRFQHVVTQSTHSANPVVCAAGLATLKVLSTGKPQAHIKKLGAMLRKSFNEIMSKHDISGCVHGNYGFVHFFIGHDCPYLGRCNPENCAFPDPQRFALGTPSKIARQLHMAMLLNGVHYSKGFGNIDLNAAVTEEDLEKVNEAFDRSLIRLKKEKIL